jgi:acyl-CoA synthetase (AMP-forming)/AMP-acid ligase II
LLNIASWLYQSALVRPDAPALFRGTRLHADYGTFARRSGSIGAYLATSCGLGVGDRVAIFMHNSPEYLELLYGILWCGCVVVPVNHKLHEREVAWIVENSGARVLFTEEGMIDDLSLLPADCQVVLLPGGTLPGEIATAARTPLRPVERDAHDTAWLFYTSGTTGRPKGVMLTHHNLIAMSTTYALDVDSVHRNDCSLYAAPISHGAGLYNFPFIRAGARHIVPESRRFEPDEILVIGADMNNLVLFAAPTMVKRLVSVARQKGVGNSGIKTVIYGGGPMYAADLDEALTVFGARFVQIYGQGESPMTITVLPRELIADETGENWRARRDSVGYAQACVRVRVVDEKMLDVPVGAIGEVIVSGDTVMKGYWQNEEATSATIVDGWLRTGDLGALDSDGFLTLKDRSKDVVISGGANIYPREVEEVLLRHDAVTEVAVVGAPDPEWGEKVVAFVVLRAGEECDAATLSDWCKAHIASFKKPSRFFFVGQLPKNNYGKIVKSQLRDMLRDEAKPADRPMHSG